MVDLTSQLTNAIISDSNPEVFRRIVNEASRLSIDLNFRQAIHRSLDRGAVRGVIKYLEFMNDHALTVDAGLYLVKMRGKGSRYLLDTFLTHADKLINENDLASLAALDPRLTDKVYYLIDRGADDFEGILISAASADNEELMRYVLRRAGDTLTFSDYQEAITAAYRNCSPRALSFLLSRVSVSEDYLYELYRTSARDPRRRNCWERVARILRI